MHLLSILLFSFSSNLDNLVIGLSYGIRKIPIRAGANLLISSLIFLFTTLAVELGESCVAFLPADFSAALGSAIMIVMGCWGLRRFFKKRARHEKPLPCAAAPLRLRAAFLLGLALCLNNIGLGVGAGFAGLPALPCAGAAFVFSFAFLLAGNKIGNSRLSRLTGRFAEPLANLIMICLGVYELFA